jgi:hypothetical protein
MEHNASWQAWQLVMKFTAFNKKMNVHHHIHNRPEPPYDEADQSSPRPQNSFLKILFSIILPPMLTSYTFLPVSLPKLYVQIFHKSVSCPVPPVKPNTKHN